MRAQRRFAPTGGRFRPERVAGIIGIRIQISQTICSTVFPCFVMPLAIF